MQRVLLSGIVLAVAVGVVTALSAVLSLEATWPVLLGAAVALVPGGRTTMRAGAFAVGLAAAWFSYALRAGFLPDLPSGRGIAIAVAVLIVTAVAAGTADRLPLWAGLAGMAAYAGFYEAAYTASPPAFAETSVVAATSVLLASALGLLAGTALQVAPGTAGSTTDSPAGDRDVAANRAATAPEVI